jgi:hypothetical protein
MNPGGTSKLSVFDVEQVVQNFTQESEVPILTFQKGVFEFLWEISMMTKAA